MNDTEELVAHDIRVRELAKYAAIWESMSHCSDSSINMFPPRADVQREIAETVCAGCPTQVECLEYALTCRTEHGVWGGTTEEGRKELIERIHAEYQIPRNIWSDIMSLVVRRYADMYVDAYNKRKNIDTEASKELKCYPSSL